jgi:hypothetical protein
MIVSNLNRTKPQHMALRESSGPRARGNRCYSGSGVWHLHVDAAQWARAVVCANPQTEGYQNCTFGYELLPDVLIAGHL